MIDERQFSTWYALLAAGSIATARIGERFVTGTLRTEGLDQVLSAEQAAEIRKAGPGQHSFVTQRVADPTLVEALDRAGVRYSGRTESNWFATVLSWVVPAVVFFALWSFLMRRMGAASGMMEIGKS